MDKPTFLSKDQIKQSIINQKCKPYFSYSSYDKFEADERKSQYGHNSDSNEFDYPCPYCSGSTYAYDSFYDEHTICIHCANNDEPGNTSKEYYIDYYNKIYIEYIDRLNTYNEYIDLIHKIIDKLTIEEATIVYNLAHNRR
jgi:hypothetical protein